MINLNDKDFTLFVDVWEGDFDSVDLNILDQMGVTGYMVRYNSVWGGMKKDPAFDRAWAKLGKRIKWPYIVWDPWWTPEENLNFARTAPACGLIDWDIELQNENVPPDQEAKNIHWILDTSKCYWHNVDCYTGNWFLPNASSWPKDVNYHWAAYPGTVYPKSRWTISWEAFRKLISDLNWNYLTPGTSDKWQFTADRLILPGTGGKAIDFNLFKGSAEKLAAQVGAGDVVIPPTTNTNVFPKHYKMTVGYRWTYFVPQTGGKAAGIVYPKSNPITIVAASDDGLWGRMLDGHWIFLGTGMVQL